MKKIKFLLVVGALLICSAEANAGWFGANWKPKPNVTLFGQTITWPLPSLCIGAKAGVLPDAGVSSKGLNLKVPYFSLDLPFPSLTISTGKDKAKVNVEVGAITKSEHKPTE